MAEETENAPEPEATEEAMESSEATENTEGQEEENQPAEDADQADKEGKSRSKARRERRAAEMERLRNEAREAEALYQKKQESLTKAQQRAAESNTPPKDDDFKDYQEYLVALGAWHAGQEMDKRRVSEIEEEAETSKAEVERLRKEAEREAQENWAAQREEATTRYSDFDAVVSAPDLPITDGMARIIANSDMGADIAYYLGTHKAEAGQIARLSPIEQAMALGRIEARVSLPKPKFQSDAPDPVTPVKPRATGMKDPAKMSNAEYRAAREAGKL